MNRLFIKYHPQSNTYVIKKRAYFDEDLVLDGNVIVGQDVNFWKNLKVKGKLELGNRSIVRGNVKAGSALLCSRSQVFGRLEVASELFLLDNAKVKAAYCQGDVFVRPGCSMGFVKAEGTLEIIGKAHIKKVEPITKVIVRAEDVEKETAEDIFEKFESEALHNISEASSGSELLHKISDDSFKPKILKKIANDSSGPDVLHNISEASSGSEVLQNIPESSFKPEVLQKITEDIFKSTTYEYIKKDESETEIDPEYIVFKGSGEGNK